MSTDYDVNDSDTLSNVVVDTVTESPISPSSSTTPPYQRLTKALQTDARCGHEVALGRRVGLYRFCGDIGRGNFSKVKLAVHQLTRDKVAIKVVDRGGLDARALRMLSREVATLECVFHPNILRLFEVIETLGRVYLVTEWVRGGEMYNHITQGGPLREVHAAPLFKQLLLAVKHMHNLGFVHRDIKAENVLLVSEDCLKLADFGFSTELTTGHNQKLDTFCGSPPYAAPELFSDDHYIGGPVDVWALGVLLHFMVVGNMPFRAPTVPALRNCVLKGDYILPGHISLPCQRLIQRILVHTPNLRPSIDEILNSQWISYPNLSIKLMEKEINQDKQANKKSRFWFRAKSRRLRKSYSLRDRYLEIRQRPPLCLSTKKTENIMIDDFLHPIDVSNYLDAANGSAIDLNSVSGKSFFSCNTLKKKISPMELETKSYINGNEIRFGEDQHNIPLESQGFKNFDIEKGDFVIMPTDTDDFRKLNQLEIEAREILEKLGITSDMLNMAVKNGPRSDIIGVYRIVINRLQKQSFLARKAAEQLVQLDSSKKSMKGRNNSILGCTIV